MVTQSAEQKPIYRLPALTPPPPSRSTEVITKTYYYAGAQMIARCYGTQEHNHLVTLYPDDALGLYAYQYGYNYEHCYIGVYRYR